VKLHNAKFKGALPRVNNTPLPNHSGLFQSSTETGLQENIIAHYVEELELVIQFLCFFSLKICVL
jgi:hypothetical protein